MFYETDKNNHGLKYNPFKSCIVPRPIAWITTLNDDGTHNCAPYSFFNGVSADPPMVMYATNGKQPMGNHKDSISNIRRNGEFVVNVVPYAAKDKMNETTAPLNPNESEVVVSKLETKLSKIVSPVRLSISPIHMECKVYKIIDLPTLVSNEYNGMVLGNVVGIHINDEVIEDGKVNLDKIKPLSRLGYLDYSVVDNIFEMHRPEGSPRPDQVKNRKDT
tara:strand:+ start:9936 stop:10592 length:657 start_codon:yes stop_codon:yes gene_type:complete